ncbi:UDP-N-acetylmuramate dehydrogenase [Rickettsia typhi]|uniref:UDP-N-acetylenolpyruvoylglucosamine reductase n=2 Tax=Rickettsia typhi TaxID=785 RepID=MURB_RICTY|nr:UDP-N-acetylmuramate dehydrogenase [Rickettsia typhi]Q68XC1.1 RecName: Full=UDP-N-acetylenolpyruvoylglucosamine reductase; AltName: Full=UDP-N-acetylmuramate dehydrogenase [Rickettsia typhi str. Wilmington]AAU03721.1 UDP-GlcNAc-enoylpyruvate reductase [Rickettsia typhi str. Wilmington]AFE54098.1 UDP-N-acetylenolpyruvoylglucosamine reductase [Rickettsia typhi str. TH1527]AFE54937.1 UDP-N-acetylenolpyruvoylglucosamine reductase [Rickettsia typhi str. B9991CWPP]
MSILPIIKGEYKKDYNLKHLTWFKVGGNAEIFFKPFDSADLKSFLIQNNKKLPITTFGSGSNIIIRDGGIEGVVIKLGKNFNNIEFLDNHLIVGSSCLNYNLAKFCQANAISGFEFLVGIPGTIGGGVVMNAGAYGSAFQDIIVQIEALDFLGNFLTFTNKEIGFKYRGNNLPKDLILLKAIFKANKGDSQNILLKMNKINTTRSSTQPIKERTGGSTFKNPVGCKSWELIDKAGLRGYRIGGASMSELHCNFMINNGNATAKDLEDLGNFVRQKVFEDSGVELNWEIKRIGKYV